jgi:hypothetical protein
MNFAGAFEEQIIKKFDIRRYERCGKLDERGWHRALELRKTMGDIDLAAPGQIEGAQAIMIHWVENPLACELENGDGLYLHPVSELTASDAWGLRQIIERDERAAGALRRWVIRGSPRRAYPGEFWLSGTSASEVEDARAALAGEWWDEGQKEAVVTSIGGFDEMVATLGLAESNVGFDTVEAKSRCGYAHLKVSMSAPDDLLIDDFRRWLTERRKGALYVEVPATRFLETDFARWTQKRVLAYLDLTLAAKCFGAKLPFHRIGSLLFSDLDDVDVGEKVRKTVVPLAEEMMTFEFIDALEHAGNPERSRRPFSSGCYLTTRLSLEFAPSVIGA